MKTRSRWRGRDQTGLIVRAKPHVPVSPLVSLSVPETT